MEAESFLIELAESADLSAAIRCQLARLALEIKNPHLALRLLQAAIASAPRSPDVRFLAGVSARALGHLTQAKDHLLLAQPDSNPDASYYLSLVHEALGDIQAARDAIQLALKNHPQDADYLNQAACIAFRLGQFDEALDKSEQAHRAEPESPEFAFNHSQNHLLVGRAQEAWPLFEARLAFTPEHLYPQNGARAWEGQPLDGKSILVWHEQGLEDSIQFSRYLPILVAQAGNVVFRCQPELLRLLGSELRGITVVSAADPLPPTDYHVPLLSVPGRLGCDLHAPPAPIFPAVKQSSQIKRIGFSYAGNPKHPDDAGRSRSLKVFSTLFESNFEWVCLQKHLQTGDHLPSGVTHPAATCRDFADTTQEIDSVDLVISVDTAVAHLAASLGKPTWILLPLCPDWRWGLRGESYSWYPSVRLFRQSQPGDWPTVMQTLRKELQIL